MDVRLSSLTTRGPVAVTPDRRYLAWTAERAPETLRLATAPEGAPVVDVASVPLGGALRGLAFDARGERALVPVGGLDAFAVIE